MAKLIDKDALVAEIERLYDEKGTFYAADVLYNLKEWLDTLEVKEVDLEKEMDNDMSNEEKEIMADAKIIQEELAMYGYRLSVKKVIDFWEWLSDEHYSAGWLIPNSKTIELAHKRGYVKEWLQKI